MAALLMASAALSAGATPYVFDIVSGGFNSGGSLTGSFSGADTNGDRLVDQTELSAFSVTYHAPSDVPGLYSFSIVAIPKTFAYGEFGFEFDVSDDATGNLVIVTDFDEQAYTPTFVDAGSNPKGTYQHISPVPEPSTWGLLAAGLAGVAWLRRPAFVRTARFRRTR